MAGLASIATLPVVGFRNEVGDAAMTDLVSPQAQQIAFDRVMYMGAEFDAQDLILTGSTGFVAINNEDSGWSTTFATSLLDGAYCDVHCLWGSFAATVPEETATTTFGDIPFSAATYPAWTVLVTIDLPATGQ
ncbi:hypothetical protein B0H13DRAFT_2496782 [Mycena leptocephala]|nr:hypothetical protein B0H13DRAFT_2496782 [Mycena leptocephala]